MNNQRVYVSGCHPTVSCFVLDSESGAMALLSTSDGGPNPTYLAAHPSGRFMYAANEVAPGRVSAYAVAPKDGRLTRINDASSAGDGPCHVSVHPSGRWVFAANYGSGTIGVLPVRPDGGVGEPLEKLAPGRNAHQILSDASGRHVFVPCLGSDWIAQYRFNAATGALTPNTPATVPVQAKAGPRHLAFHPSERCACLINELDSTMIALRYDAAQGLLAPATTAPTLPAGYGGKNATAHVLFMPSGRFVYGSNRGHDSVAIYAFDAQTMALRLIGHETGGGAIAWPRDFALDLSGRYLLVANQKGNSVSVFRCNSETGALSKLSTVAVPPAPTFVGVVAG
jgi:6-phosphogluconolactonase